LREEGMDFPVPPEFWWSTDIRLIRDGSGNPSQDLWAGRIDSVKIKMFSAHAARQFFHFI